LCDIKFEYNDKSSVSIKNSDQLNTVKAVRFPVYISNPRDYIICLEEREPSEKICHFKVTKYILCIDQISNLYFDFDIHIIIIL